MGFMGFGGVIFHGIAHVSYCCYPREYVESRWRVKTVLMGSHAFKQTCKNCRGSLARLLQLPSNQNESLTQNEYIGS